MLNTKEIIESVLNDFFQTKDVFGEDEFGEKTIVVDETDASLLAQAIDDVLKARGII